MTFHFVGEENFFSILQDSSGWSKSEIDMKQMNRRESDLIMYR